MAIPVQNIYFLLSYAWDRLHEQKCIKVDIENSAGLVELFARVLCTGINQLSRTGLDRGYVEKRETLRVLRGRICIPETINVLGLQRGALVCDYDELTHDVLINQILKATLRLLLRATANDSVTILLAAQIRSFHDVTDIRLEASHFGRVVLHRNNRLYGFLLDICQMIRLNLLPNEKTGEWKFRDFLRDQRQMGLLFEHFVRNFFKYHKGETGFSVDRENIQWMWKPQNELSRSLLPQMQTDIRLRNDKRKILVECKFTWIAKMNQHEVDRLISPHLYQLNAYLTHLPSKPENDSCEAILLYPADGTDYSLRYADGERIIRIKTINLAQHWQDIHKSLIELIGCSQSEPIPT